MLRWNDVALRIFHHPGHTENLDRTMQSMKASLEYFTGQFGPYPYSDLRIVEIFEHWGFEWGGHWKRPDGMHFELDRVGLA